MLQAKYKFLRDKLCGIQTEFRKPLSQALIKCNKLFPGLLPVIKVSVREPRTGRREPGTLVPLSTIFNNIQQPSTSAFNFSVQLQRSTLPGKKAVCKIRYNYGYDGLPAFYRFVLTL